MADPFAERLEVLIAGIAHDLRNPLNTLAMSTGLLKDDLEAGDIDPKRELLLVGRLERSVDRMRRSIDDLAEAARIGAGKVEAHAKKEDPAKIVKEAYGPAAATTKERTTELTLGTVAEGLTVMTDRARLAQAIDKTAGLCARLTGEGGRAELSLEKSGNQARFVFVARGRAAALTMPEENKGGVQNLVAKAFIELLGSKLEIAIEDGAAVLSFKLPVS